ncbi:LOW QUALITY PROTEIN: probable cytochrome P450 28a5 [Drosophila eugracilis]|uniref:LOW QUALITY PROTEIN: probable cytochrome P450 28a5 n=1 Tax=Drosophila eugracilis TaxID=29029 RepID=UPI001BDA4339|nr:LOW QUALITY PROTEIN: probable cytochrome P450 28a5 [Drosophila eugracilis]
MILITLTLLLFVVGLLYAVFIWNYDHWKKRGVPGPKPKIFCGNYPSMFTMKRHAVYDLDEIYRKYKNKYDAVGIYSARSPQLLVVNPELARRVFVSNFKNFHDNDFSKNFDEKTDFIFANNPFTLTGEKWKSRRADVTPGLTMGRIKTVYPVTNKVCHKLSEWVEKQIRLGSTDGINAKNMSLAFTSEMVTDCVLGLKAESFSDKPTPIMQNIKDLFNQPWTFVLFFILTTTFPSLSHLIKLRFVPLHVERFFVDLMGSAVEARRAQLASGKQFERSDFLDYILQLGEKRNLDNRQLLAYSMTFLLDGFETTAAVLAHMLLNLGRNPKAQETLRQELRAHLKNGIINFDNLNDLPYLDACLQETIRLFPPGFMSNKLCTESLEIPNKDGPNFIVEKGTTVVVPHYSFMLDEDFFPDPQSFQPERFMEPDAAKTFRERGVFMGFGDGPRVCIGMRFATTQIKAAAVELISKFNVKINPKTRKDNDYDPGLIITSLRGGIWLDLEKL